MKNKRRNIKIIFGFIVGLIIPTLGIYTAATSTNANQVSYNDTDVKAALDELYADLYNEYFDYATSKANTTGKVFASKKGVCISRNKTVHCFKPNNFAEEQNHVQQVFSDSSCQVYSSFLHCPASDFYCNVFSNGNVHCTDLSDHSSCTVTSGGSITCD